MADTTYMDGDVLNEASIQDGDVELDLTSASGGVPNNTSIESDDVQVQLMSMSGDEVHTLTSIGNGGGGGCCGTYDYNELYNKPQIESVELIGNKTFEDLGLDDMSNIEIYNIVNSTDLGV